MSVRSIPCWRKVLAVRHPDAMEAYLRQVLQQIRWKRARTVIGQELQNHLEDQYQAFLEEGLSPTEAEAETVRQMGDPVSVGKALDALHRPRREWSFLWLALLLLGCGILLSLANAGFQWNRIFQARLGCAVIGLVLGVLLYFWDGKLLCDKPVLLAVLLGLVPLFARRFYSSSFDLTFDQGLLLLPLAMGLMVCAMRGHGWRGISACLQLEFLLILDCIQAKSFYFTCFIILFCLFLLLKQAAGDPVPQSRKLGMVLIVGFHIAAVAVFWLLRGALSSFLPVNSSEFGAASLPYQIFWGSRWFSSDVTTLSPSQLSLLQDRFALTWLARQYGMIVVVLLVGIVLLFLARGFRICQRQGSPLGRDCGRSILSALAFESLGYFAQCMIGLPGAHFFLPLVDTSGPALVVELALIGLLLGLFRQNTLLEARQLHHWFLGEAVC